MSAADTTEGVRALLAAAHHSYSRRRHRPSADHNFGPVLPGAGMFRGPVGAAMVLMSPTHYQHCRGPAGRQFGLSDSTVFDIECGFGGGWRGEPAPPRQLSAAWHLAYEFGQACRDTYGGPADGGAA